MSQAWQFLPLFVVRKACISYTNLANLLEHGVHYLYTYFFSLLLQFRLLGAHCFTWIDHICTVCNGQLMIIMIMIVIIIYFKRVTQSNTWLDFSLRPSDLRIIPFMLLATGLKIVLQGIVSWMMREIIYNNNLYDVVVDFQILRNRSYLLLAFVFGTGMGVLTSLTTLMEQILQPNGYSDVSMPIPKHSLSALALQSRKTHIVGSPKTMYC